MCVSFSSRNTHMSQLEYSEYPFSQWIYLWANLKHFDWNQMQFQILWVAKSHLARKIFPFELKKFILTRNYHSSILCRFFQLCKRNKVQTIFEIDVCMHVAKLHFFILFLYWTSTEIPRNAFKNFRVINNEPDENLLVLGFFFCWKNACHNTIDKFQRII